MADIFPESREEEILVSMIDGEEYNKAPESRIEALLLELKEVIEEGGGGGGTTNYNLLQNKPSINSVTLTGDKSSADLGIPTASDLAGKQDVLPVTASGNDVAFNGDIQDGQGNTLSVLAEALTKTASGNPVVITDCAGGKARSLKTVINAIQDLHGYDKPWSGGANGNLFGNFTFSDSRATHEYTELTGTLKVICNQAQGKGSQTVLSISDVSNLLGETLTWSITGHNQSKSSLKPYVTVYKNGQTSLANLGDSGEGITKTSTSFVVPNDTQSLSFLFRVDQSETDVSGDYLELSGLQLEIGNSVSSFRPYSNICPISGRSSVVLTRSDGDEISEDFTIQLGTTVYGADINWDTGVMTVKTAKVDISTLDIKQFPNTSVFYASVEDGSNDNVPPTSITSCYKLNTTSGVTGVADGEFQYGKPVVVTGNRAFNCRDDRYNTVADFKAGIAGQDLEYPLATPTSIQLTPTQLEMLKGYNRVTIESGSIELGYIAKAISGNDEEEIAPTVGDKATKAYAVNDFIERADGLYRVTAPIASGASFTANNTVKMSIGEALTYLYNK